jgi:hypothetical protein
MGRRNEKGGEDGMRERMGLDGWDKIAGAWMKWGVRRMDGNGIRWKKEMGWRWGGGGDGIGCDGCDETALYRKHGMRFMWQYGVGMGRHENNYSMGWVNTAWHAMRWDGIGWQGIVRMAWDETAWEWHA